MTKREALAHALVEQERIKLDRIPWWRFKALWNQRKKYDAAVKHRSQFV